MHIKPCQRTRYAPTPSGFLHLGNVYSFALTAVIAKESGCSILLRIDDMDTQRAKTDHVQDVFGTLRFLDLPWQEGPRSPEEHNSHFSQQHRLPLYTAALEQIRSMGHVFACNCSRSVKPDFPHGCAGDCRSAGISLDTPGVAWRLDTRAAGNICVNGMNGSMRYEFPQEMNDFVIRRKDGLPAYQLCSLADDEHFEVDLVVRGRDLLPSTLAQLYLAGLLGYKKFCSAVFVHHRLISDGNGKKMSKSEGAESVRYLRNKGSSPGQVFQLMAEKAGLGRISRWQDFRYLQEDI